MNGWSPLHQKIVASSVWAAKYHVRLAWITLLATADKNGIVHYGTVGLQRMANITIAEAREAVDVLSSPDPDTLTQEAEGRRIEPHAQGWRIVNWTRYRMDASSQAIREHEAARKAEQRQKAKSSPVPPPEDQRHHHLQHHPHTIPGHVPDKRVDKETVYSSQSRVALHFLNEKSGRKFRETSENLGTIDARLKEPGVDIEGVKKMIDRQCRRWNGTSQAEYLRPETLFGKTKFDGYYAAKDLPISDLPANGQQPRPEEKSLAIKIAEAL